MKRGIVAGMALALLIPVYSFAQMKDGGMEKQMKEHMGGGMDSSSSVEGSSKEKKGVNEETKANTKEAEAAGVTLKVTYKNPAEAKNPIFNVVLDTHSVDLDQYKFDSHIVLLRDDTGKEYHPDLISTTGSGHHREAVLEFKEADISGAKYVEVVVKGVGGVDERVLKFEVKKDSMKQN